MGAPPARRNRTRAMPLIRVPLHVLPAPEVRDLPEAPRLRRLFGPSLILAGLSIGSGEFVLWPRLTAEWGFAVFWAAWVGVTLQFFLNMEIERWTLATGESAVAGFFRMSRAWGPVFLVCGTVPWIWPGWATGAATLVSWELGGNVTGLAMAGLVACGAILSVGPVVYRTVETIQSVLVPLIFVLLLGVAWNVVTPDAVRALAVGATRVGFVPEGVHLPLLLGALAFAGAGGTVNLAQSNYIKDKGYGMGRFVGRITSPFTGRREATPEVGFVFPDDPANLARWRRWWRLTNSEHFLSFYLLCVLSLALTCLVAYALLEPGDPVSPGFAFIADEATGLESRFGPASRRAFLAAGVVVLFSTELALLDAVARVTADTLALSLFRRRPEMSVSRLYFLVVWTLVAFGIGVLGLGFDQPLVLLVLSAALNGFVMFLYSGLLLALNLRSFRPPLRPGLLRTGVLGLTFLFFGYFSALTLLDRLGALE
jgi:hypothetical protein